MAACRSISQSKRGVAAERWNSQNIASRAIRTATTVADEQVTSGAGQQVIHRGTTESRANVWETRLAGGFKSSERWRRSFPVRATQLQTARLSSCRIRPPHSLATKAVRSRSLSTPTPLPLHHPSLVVACPSYDLPSPAQGSPSHLKYRRHRFAEPVPDLSDLAPTVREIHPGHAAFASGVRALWNRSSNP